jgi:hypothetical protein
MYMRVIEAIKKANQAFTSRGLPPIVDLSLPTEVFTRLQGEIDANLKFPGRAIASSGVHRSTLGGVVVHGVKIKRRPWFIW